MFLKLAAIFAAVAVLTGAVVYFAVSGSKEVQSSDARNQMLALGQSTYMKNCASCHGPEGQGQPGWRTNTNLAPPHDATGHTWKHADRSLFRFIKTGLLDDICTIGVGNAMPRFKDVMSDREIKAVIAYLNSRWPPQVRSVHQAINREYDREDDALTGG